MIYLPLTLSPTRACVIYASTSGTTRAVAQSIAECPAIESDLVDLSEWDHWAPRIFGKRYSLVFLGTPTYGQGDWHYLWDKHSHEVVTAISRCGQVAIFGLGDARGHARSFAGGLSPLSRFFRQCGFPMCGKTTPERFKFESSPALVGGCFPGLVIDFKREHRRAESLVHAWVADLVQEIEGTRLRWHGNRSSMSDTFPKPDGPAECIAEGQIQ